MFERAGTFRPGKKHGNNPRKAGLRIAGIRPDGYVAWSRDGKRHFNFELELQKRERAADEAIRKVRAFEAVNAIEKAILARYIGLMWRRGGPQETEIQSMVELNIEEARFDSVAMKFADAGQFADARHLLDEQEWLRSKYGKTELLRETVLSGFDQVHAVLMQLKWVFCRAPAGDHFLTCDVPVVFDRSLGLRRSPLRFPISSEVLLLATWMGEKDLESRVLSADEVRVENAAIISSAIRHVYSSSPDEWIQKALEHRPSKTGDT
jgi:hypothetical protein